MIQLNPLLSIDGYKSSHKKMYPKDTTLVYSNYTCRSTKRMPKGCDKIVVFGVQYMIKKLVDYWNTNFLINLNLYVKKLEKYFQNISEWNMMYLILKVYII